MVRQILSVTWCWTRPARGGCRIFKERSMLGRFLPFHSTSVNPLLFHFATPGHPSIQFWYGAAHPIPPRLRDRDQKPEPKYPLSLPLPCPLSLTHSFSAYWSHHPNRA